MCLPSDQRGIDQPLTTSLLAAIFFLITISSIGEDSSLFAPANGD